LVITSRARWMIVRSKSPIIERSMSRDFIFKFRSGYLRKGKGWDIPCWSPERRSKLVLELDDGGPDVTEAAAACLATATSAFWNWREETSILGIAL
jgi:hypothetical protein